MLHRLTEVAYGPFLRFESYTPPMQYDVDSVWKGSVMYVCHTRLTESQLPLLKVTDDETSLSIEGSQYDAYKDWNFWRFDLKFVLTDIEREIDYQLQLPNGQKAFPVWSFFVPGAMQTWRWSAYSCSGFSHGVNWDDWMVEGDHPMVYHLLQEHRTKPLHMNFGGGDQLYNDGVFEDERIVEWLNTPDRHQRLTSPFTRDLREATEDYFFAHYCLHFETKSLREMCASIPNVMLWDDHDIFDGWGSYPEDMLHSPVFYGIFLVARRFYLSFQHQTTVERVQEGKTDLFGDSPMRSPSFSFVKLIGPTVAILGVDIRAERTKDQVLSQESWNLIFRKLRDLPGSVRHLVVNLTVPIVYPKVPISEALYEMVSHMNRSSAVNALLVKTNILSSMMKFEFDEPELLDDLIDHWTCVHHQEERKRVVESFQQLATDRRLRVTFVSGDVHCAAIGRFYSHPKMSDLSADPFFMPQIITSAIINVPPPSIAIKIMHTFDRAGNRINRHTREKMVRFFKKKYPREEKVLPKRNFLIVDEHEDETLKMSLFIEDHRHMMHRPDVFDTFVPELKTPTALTRTVSSSSAKKSWKLVQAYQSAKTLLSRKQRPWNIMKQLRSSFKERRDKRSQSFT